MKNYIIATLIALVFILAMPVSAYAGTDNDEETVGNGYAGDIIIEIFDPFNGLNPINPIDPLEPGPEDPRPIAGPNPHDPSGPYTLVES